MVVGGIQGLWITVDGCRRLIRRGRLNAFPYGHMGGYQNYGPLLDPLNTIGAVLY